MKLIIGYFVTGLICSIIYYVRAIQLCRTGSLFNKHYYAPEAEFAILWFIGGYVSLVLWGLYYIFQRLLGIIYFFMNTGDK